MSFQQAKEKAVPHPAVGVVFAQTHIRELGKPLARFGASLRKILVVTLIGFGMALFIGLAVPNEKGDEVVMKIFIILFAAFGLIAGYLSQGRHVTVYQHGFRYGGLFLSQTIYHTDIEHMTPHFIMGRAVDQNGNFYGPSSLVRIDYQLQMRNGSKIYFRTSGYPNIFQIAHWLGVSWNPAISQYRFCDTPSTGRWS